MKLKIRLFGALIALSDRCIVIKPPHSSRHFTFHVVPEAGSSHLTPHVTDERRKAWHRRLARFTPTSMKKFFDSFGEALAERWWAACSPTSLDDLIAGGWQLVWFREEDFEPFFASLKRRDGTYEVTEKEFEQFAELAWLLPCDALRDFSGSLRHPVGIVREVDGELEQRWLVDYREAHGSWFTLPLEWLPPDEFERMIRERLPRLDAVAERARRFLRLPDARRVGRSQPVRG